MGAQNSFRVVIVVEAGRPLEGEVVPCFDVDAGGVLRHVESKVTACGDVEARAVVRPVASKVTTCCDVGTKGAVKPVESEVAARERVVVDPGA